MTESDDALKLLWRNNIDPHKVNFGIALYGRTFTLNNPACSSAGCPIAGAGKPGRCTQTSGLLSHSEIREVVAGGAKVVMDNTAAVKIATWGDSQWASYDDEDTLKLKMRYANANCLGG